MESGVSEDAVSGHIQVIRLPSRPDLPLERSSSIWSTRQ